MKLKLVSVFCLFIILSPEIARSHHSLAGVFNARDLVEIEGEVTSTSWRNPHTEFEIAVEDASGQVTHWRVESADIAILRARGVDRTFLRPGDYVKVLGNPSLHGRPEVFGRNLQLGNGREVLLTVSAQPHFSLQDDVALLKSQYSRSAEVEGNTDVEGLFRVWSTNFDERPASAFAMLSRERLQPLTREAEAVRAAWDPATAAGCEPRGMPHLMSTVQPIEFVRQGADILLRFEHDDSRRFIGMTPPTNPSPVAHSLLGRSFGSFDDDTLVVETDYILANRLDQIGTHHSSEIRLVERFTPSADGRRLDYELTMTDPETFLEPVSVERYWIWRPEIEVGRYDCGQEQELG